MVLSRVCNEYQAHVVAYSQDFLPDLGEQVPGLRVFFVRVQPFQVVIGHARSRAVVGGGSLNVEVSESAAGAFLGDDYRVPRMGLQGGWMCSRVRRFSRSSVACHKDSWPVAVCLVSGGHLQGNRGCVRCWVYARVGGRSYWFSGGVVIFGLTLLRLCVKHVLSV